MNFNRRRFVVGSIVLLLVGGLLLALINKPREVGILNKESEATKLYDSATLAGLPQRSASSADTSHLAQGVSPPTNSWFSGMVLQRVPQAVFPMPHSFLAKEDGFEIGLPTISSTATSINGGHTPGLVAEIGATGFQLSRYDKLSATLTYRNDAKIIGELTISEGSPFVFYTAKQAGEIKLEDRKSVV